ncbi:MAG TPA: protein TolR [Candidatus Limnocylindria bacterium]|nr:protein TolR [Candidatus Limnocylindria bacterium]
MAFGSGESGQSISDINVTPLVDVMLVLLVIFMVTAPILQQGVAVNLPQAAGDALPADEKQLVVSIDGQGRIFLNDDQYTSERLAAELAQLAAVDPDRRLYVRADAGVPYGQVIETLAAVRQAGLSRVGLITEPPERR